MRQVKKGSLMQPTMTERLRGFLWWVRGVLGEHAYDQWSVDELIALAKATTSTRASDA